MKSGKMQFLRTRAESLGCLTWSNREGVTQKQRGALAEEKVPGQSEEKGLKEILEQSLNLSYSSSISSISCYCDCAIVGDYMLLQNVASWLKDCFGLIILKNSRN